MNIHRIDESFLRHFRSKRMRSFIGMFGVTDATPIIDAGSYEFNWRLSRSQLGCLR